jgi:hypothetical protein
MKKKICAYCQNPIDRVVENAKERIETAVAMETGKFIYNAIMDKRFRSIDLCNFDYVLLRIYRVSLKEDVLMKCPGDLEMFYGMCVIEDLRKSL